MFAKEDGALVRTKASKKDKAEFMKVVTILISMKDKSSRVCD